MESGSTVLKDTAVMAAGLAVCVAAMIGIFALIGHFDVSVVWGGVVGGLIALANYFIMILVANLAADKAEKQDVAGGQKMIQLSYTGRMIGLVLVLILCGKSGLFNVITLVVPLAFTRPILTLTEYIKKKGGKTA